MIIYDKAGSILLDIEVDDTSVRYKAIKGENSLTLKFSLAEHVEVPLGSYCVFKGETYTLMMPEDLTMNHRRSFEYTLVMYSEDAMAKRYVFVNPVDGRVKFSLTAKPVEHLQMFVDNMNMRDSGWSVGECPDHVEIALSYNSTKCHDALVQLADELELDYWFNGKVVNIGKLELNKDNPLPLSYGGDGEGLKPNVKRTNYSDALPIEVLFVQGTETNIDASKYGASELHLPKGQTIRFDGTYFEDEDGFDESKARSYKTDENGYSVTRADKEIVNHSEDSLDCSDIEPTKEESVSSVIEVNKEKHFYDILFASDVDYSKYVIGGENATVVFQSGMLAGKEFDLATDSNGNLICKKEADLWRVEIVPQEIDGITMPDADSGYIPTADDTFKVFGIQLPSEYISDNETKSGAEWDMFRFAVKHFYANEGVQYTISGELDEIYAKRNWERIKDRLTLGSYISFSDRSFQEEPLLIRITGIKDYVNKPYSPQLEISNAALSGTLVGALNRIENQEVETEDKIRQAIGFSKRKWRDAKETLSMLTGAVANFTEGISPITVETMSMLVGDERLQFIFTESLASDVVVDLMYSYDLSTGTFSVQSGFIKHMTLGIDSISPVHANDEYKRWSVAEVSEVLDRELGYYLYAKVSKDSTSGAFELHDTIQTDTEEWYYLLVGILNSEYDGDRSFASMYGYTEVRPGQITTDNIRSSDGNTWLDLLKGILYLNNMAGVSGVKTEEKGDQSIAAWFGGLMKDIELDDDKENAAKSVIRHDGTGYFADGLFKWDKDKGVNLGNGAIWINYDGSVDFGDQIRIGASGDETLGSLLTIVATLADIWKIDEDGNLVTDRNVIIKNNLIIEGDTASGGEGSSDVNVGINEEQLKEYLDANKYVTEAWIAEQRYVTLATYATGIGQLGNRITTIENSYVTGSTLASYALKSEIPTTLPASDVYAWAKKSSLALSDVPDLSSKYLPLSGGTINGTTTDPIIVNTSETSVGVRLQINKVNKAYVGYGSSVGAYLYNYDTSAYIGVDTSGTPYYNNGTIKTTLIHSGNIGSYNAGSATKLQTARSIWGQSFDGTRNVSGNIQGGKANFTIYGYNSTSASNVNILTHDNNKSLWLGYGMNAEGNATIIAGTSIEFRYGTSRGIAALINSSGNVLVGTTTDKNSGKLQVNGDINIPTEKSYKTNGLDAITLKASYGLYIGNGTSDTYNTLLWGQNISLVTGTNGQTRLYVKNDGNVGIGTTSPAYKLDVNGDIGVKSAYLSHTIFMNRGAEGIYIGGSNIHWHNASNVYAKSLINFAADSIILHPNVTINSNLIVTGDVAVA